MNNRLKTKLALCMAVVLLVAGTLLTLASCNPPIEYTYILTLKVHYFEAYKGGFSGLELKSETKDFTYKSDKPMENGKKFFCSREDLTALMEDGNWLEVREYLDAASHSGNVIETKQEMEIYYQGRTLGLSFRVPEWKIPSYYEKKNPVYRVTLNIAVCVDYQVDD